jgi:DNA polymerase-1
MNNGKLFLLDGMALVYRAFFAFSQNPRITSSGLNASAMFGFTNTLLDIINKQKPTHLAVVFDTDKPTHRHIEFETYKAHREEMPEDLRKSLPYIVRILEAFNVPVITMDGFEADDIIGTLAWRVEGVDVFMMTPDKDFGQLVRDRVYIYKPGRMGNPDEILGVPEILSRWEVERVDQVIDILGLWGDAVDNIPGVPGVGEKTAKKLIQEYGSLEGVLQNVDQLKGKMKEKFQEFSEQAIVSKRLATIDTQVPVEITLEDLARKEPNEELLTQVFQELEFRTMLKRVFPGSASGLMDGDTSGVPDKTSPEKPKKRVETNPMQTSLFGFESNDDGVEAEEAVAYLTIKDVSHDYSIIQSEEDWSNLLKELHGVSEFCFDTETSDLDLFEAKIVGVSLTWKENQGVYIPISSLEDEAKKQLAKLADVFNSDKLKIAQNLKFDMAILKKYGLEIKGPFFDTMLAHYLIEPDQRHNMQVLSESYLGYSPISIENLIGKKGKNQGSMADVPLEMIAEYAAEDTDVTFQLKKKLEVELTARGLDDVFSNIEMPLVRVLMEMEHEGVRIDVDFLNHYSKELNDQAVAIQQRIFELAGLQFNIASPSQVGNILFDHLKLVDKPKKTKTGQYQTDEETLQSLKGKHEIIDHILSFRALQKLKSTYVDALPAIVKVQSGKVHTSFNQAVAATGRLSSQNPNLQNIPIRTDLGREIRKAFIPSDTDHVLLSADYSQIELRIIAHISKDPAMIEAFRSGIDIHTATASKVWGVPIDEVDKDMRRKAKTVNFGIIYGISAFGLSQRVQISRGEAKEIIDNYFIQFPGIKAYMEGTVNSARELGYVETITGRRRNLRDINSRNATVRGFAERNAINAPIQGSAADMIKIAMIKIQDWLRSSGLKTKMILQVHDELLFDVPKNEVEIVSSEVKKWMESAIPLDVPVLVEWGTGENWLEAH